MAEHGSTSKAPSEEEENENEGFVDTDLLDESAAEETPKKKPSAAAKKRGRKKGDGETSTRRRPFVESNVAANLAKSDLMDVMNRWDWDSAEYDCSLSRAQPQSWQGRNCHGFLASFTHALDENYILQHFGGGVFDIRVRGPNPQTGVKKQFLDGCRVRIAGPPILSDADRNYITPDGGGVIMANPIKGPPSGRHRREALENMGEQKPAWAEKKGGNGTPPPNDDMLRRTFDHMAERERETASEARALRERLLEQSQIARSDGTMSQEALRIMQEAADRAIDAERRSGERQREEFERIRHEEKENRREFDTLITRLGDRHTGIPPEMLQTLSEQHRAEINALNEARNSQLTQEHGRADREMRTIRERYESEIQLLREKAKEDLAGVRNDLQSRLDRETDSVKRETERARDQAAQDVAKIREEMVRRLDEDQKESTRRLDSMQQEHARQQERDREQHQRQVDQDREQSRLRLEATEKQTRRDLEAAEARANSERTSITSQHQMQLEHLKGLQGGQIDQQRSQFEAQIAQLNATHEAASKMQESTLNAQIVALTNELDRTRSDLQATQIKVSEQGDLVKQAATLKEVGDSLGSVFGLGRPSDVSVAASAPADLGAEAKSDRPKGWMGSLMDFADSRVGEMAFEFLRQAAVGAAGPPPGAMVPPGLPGQSSQQPPSGYGPPPGAYGPPPGAGAGYGPPPTQPNPYQPPYHQPDPDGVGQGMFVDENENENENENEVEVEEVSPQNESAFQTEIRDGVVTTKPPSKPHVEEQDEPVSAFGQEKPPAVEGPKESSYQEVEPLEQEIPPEVKKQLMGLIQGLENAMTSGTPVAELADQVIAAAPAEQLRPFADTPINQLAMDVSGIVPGTLLASHSGRKYLSQLQTILKQKIGA